ncbi:heme oxygenase-like protein [Aspergillus sclerotiicarbonarius CBS 121057]|uniref:Heme oxygenase-like protein n=1 Tax=Aspergillus sclerotiicarbonarius (strain CBS 121057 / IBT 28362) TaxID=1448318 RepID=A0A319ELU1_ASPSB|nr:heme oxygenase-like protein [Aspergillus sclerotiicarbonarius CBS 121057]
MASTDLSSKIRNVIKDPHSAINRLNTSRIPLCLPPHTTSPTLYALGFSRYAEIYLGFEEAWQTQLSTSPLAPLQTSPIPPSSSDNRIHTILHKIYIPELQRTRHVKADLASLPNLPDSTNKTNSAQEFRMYINARVAEKPYLLIAYVCIMYSALFNGGRWIKGLLRDAGREFWGVKGGGGGGEVWKEGRFSPPLSFWEIEGDGEGRDGVREELRKRMVEVDGLLMEEERKEILDEALVVMRWCEGITLELDRDVLEMGQLDGSTLNGKGRGMWGWGWGWRDWVELGRGWVGYLMGWK